MDSLSLKALRVKPLLAGFLGFLVLISFWRLGVSFWNDPGFKAKIFGPTAFHPENEPKTSAVAGALLLALKNPKFEGGDLLHRNLFEPWKAPPMVEVRLRLLSIRRKGPHVFYQGLMQEDDGSYIAQINFEGRSYFLKEGENVKGWGLETLTPEEILMRDPNGKAFRFTYRAGGGFVKRKGIYAVIIKEPEKSIYKVREGETFEDYTVQEISENAVRIIREHNEFNLQLGHEGIIVDRMEMPGFVHGGEEDQGDSTQAEEKKADANV